MGLARVFRVFGFICSFSCLAAGLALSLAHPLAPTLTAFLFCAVFTLTLWRPAFGLQALPTLLPVLNFSPWSGWLIVDEFDLLILSVLGAGYFRIGRGDWAIREPRRYFVFLAIALAWVARSIMPIGLRDLSGFADFSDPLNGFRVSKSLLWIALLFPLLSGESNDASFGGSNRRFLGACLCGSVFVVLAIVWERAFYPGLFDFSTPYRTVAGFWEMRLGGAALDVYLVLVAPLLVWGWRATRSSAYRLAFGVFILVFVYGCLTTYSRGVIASIAGALCFLAMVLIDQRAKNRPLRRIFSVTGSMVVVFALIEAALIAGADTVLNERLAASKADFGSRLQHWERGLATLKTPGDWLFGIGWGRLPERLTQGEARLPLPGRLFPDTVSGRPTMALTGPDSVVGLGPGGGFYDLSQRVDLSSGNGYRFSADVFSERDADLLVKVCAAHLLYPARCRDRMFHVDSSGWQHKQSDFLRPLFKPGDWQAVGHGVVLLAVLTPEAKVELGRLSLTDGAIQTGEPVEHLRNARFRDGAAEWFPVARFYFLPWHIDNLYLEVLIETGLVGLTGFTITIAIIIRRCIRVGRRGDALAPYLLTSIVGLLALGMVVSMFDMPRVAILFGMVLLRADQASRADRGTRSRCGENPAIS